MENPADILKGCTPGFRAQIDNILQGWCDSKDFWTLSKEVNPVYAPGFGALYFALVTREVERRAC